MTFDSLDIFAEVGAALAGFATIAGVLQEDVSHRHNALGVVQTSIVAMIFALVPRLVGDLQVSALLFLVGWSALWTGAGIRNARLMGSVVAVPLPRWVIAVNFVLACAGSLIAIAVVIDKWPDRALQLYSWCLMCAILTSSHLLVEVGRTLFLGGVRKTKPED